MTHSSTSFAHLCKLWGNIPISSPPAQTNITTTVPVSSKSLTYQHSIAHNLHLVQQKSGAGKLADIVIFWHSTTFLYFLYKDNQFMSDSHFKNHTRTGEYRSPRLLPSPLVAHRPVTALGTMGMIWTLEIEAFQKLLHFTRLWLQEVLGEADNSIKPLWYSRRARETWTQRRNAKGQVKPVKLNKENLLLAGRQQRTFLESTLSYKFIQARLKKAADDLNLHPRLYPPTPPSPTL